MEIDQDTTDLAILAEVGRRVAQHRLQRNWTQAMLAQEAGVSSRTLVRLEKGESVQMVNLIRVMRALGLLNTLAAWVASPVASPIEQLRFAGKRRQRASRRSIQSTPEDKWVWDEQEDAS